MNHRLKGVFSQGAYGDARHRGPILSMPCRKDDRVCRRAKSCTMFQSRAQGSPHSETCFFSVRCLPWTPDAYSIFMPDQPFINNFYLPRCNHSMFDRACLGSPFQFILVGTGGRRPFVPIIYKLTPSDAMPLFQYHPLVEQSPTGKAISQYLSSRILFGYNTANTRSSPRPPSHCMAAALFPRH